MVSSVKKHGGHPLQAQGVKSPLSPMSDQLILSEARLNSRLGQKREFIRRYI